MLACIYSALLPFACSELAVLFCRKNAYDGETEYFVVVREKQQREEQHVQEQIERGVSKAMPAPCAHLHWPM